MADLHIEGAMSLSRLAADLRGFDRRKEVVKQLRKEIRKPVPATRAEIKRRALSMLPSRNGLNRWVAGLRITAKITLGARSAGVWLRGGRRNTKGRADVRRIDQGAVRAPSWGRRGPGQWHVQAVRPGFFTGVTIAPFQRAVVEATEQAARSIADG